MATVRVKRASKAGQPAIQDVEDGIGAFYNQATAAEGPQPVPSISYTRMLFRHADRLDLALLAAGVIGSIVSGVLSPVFSIFFGDLLNSFFGGDVEQGINRMVLRILWVAIGSFFGGLLEVGCLMWSGARQATRVRSLYLRSYLRQDAAFFDGEGNGTGSMLQGLNDDAAAFQAAISEKLGTFIHMMSVFVAGTVIAFWKGWELSLVFFSSIPVLAGVTAAVGVMHSKLQSRNSRAYAAAAGISQQALAHIRTVASFSLEGQTVDKYQAALSQPVKVGVWEGMLAGLTLGVTHFVFFGAYGLAFWYGSQRVADGKTSGGYVMNVILSAVMAGFGLGQAMPNLPVFRRGCAAAASLFSVIGRRPKIDIDAEGLVPDTVQGELELRDVTFAYPVRPDKPVLRCFSLTIPPHKTVALVGESGSGKSSLVALLQRFYDPQHGAVLLDGRDVRGLQLRWLRAQMGLVSQEPTLFAASIRDNIAMGLPGATDEQIIAAATAANAYGFILKLPQGLDTLAGERGSALSGGQKQRIAIARAILRTPKILLLDEATSALDAQSEKAVQGALEALMSGGRSTVVVIAHRLSTIMSADSIAVVKNGSVVEQGKHGQLLKVEGGMYRNLVARQQMVAAEPADSLQAGEESPAADAASPQQRPRGPARKLRDSVLRRGSVRLSIIPDSVRQKLSGPQGQAGKKDGAASAGKVPFSRLASLQTRREWALGALALLVSAVVGLQMPGFSLALASVVADLFSPDPDDVRGGGSKWGLVFMGVGLGCLLLETFQGWSFAVLGQNLARRVRTQMLSAVLRQDMAWFDKTENSSGSILSRLSNDASAVRGCCADNLGLMFQNLGCAVASFIIAFYSSWSVTLVVAAVLPLMIAGQAVQAAVTFNSNQRDGSSLAEANQLATEATASIRVVAAYSLQEQVASLYSRSASGSGSRKASLAGGLGYGFSMFVLYTIFCLGFWFGGTQIRAGRISFQELLRAFLALFYCAFGLAQASAAFPDVGRAGAALARVFGIIDRQSPIDPSSNSGTSFEQVDGHIELRGVTFAYPSRPGRLVFKQFSLDVPAGTCCALVGESGHGKSTLIGLLERFYDPLEGQVLLDGVDIRSLNVRWLRSQLGLVGQEPVLFAGSVADNIRMGAPGASTEQVAAAARLANAFEFVAALPGGFEAHVGEGGIQLSGGQKQRIAIARALLRNPKVLLLDEATSALDAESEAVVQEALERVMAGRTSIVVAHRLTTVRRATKIAVVFRGRVLEQGTHDELVALQGYYTHLLEASQS